MCSIAFMPIMLCTKPCMFLMSSKKEAQVDSHGCVELVKIKQEVQ